MSWTHPTGRAPKTVNVVGLGPTHQDYDQAWLNPSTPDVLWKADETWGINRGIFSIKSDLQWIMDFVEGECHGWPVYGAKIWNSDVPIITSAKPAEYPEHIHVYPFAEIWTWLQMLPQHEWTDERGILRKSVGPPVHCDWWHNSVAYVIAYAAFIGVEKLYCWGLDYHHHRSDRVEDGHVNVAYWVAKMEQVGLQVIPYSASTFLNANQRNWIYGYPPGHDPRPPADAKRQQFRILAGIDKGGEGG